MHKPASRRNVIVPRLFRSLAAPVCAAAMLVTAIPAAQAAPAAAPILPSRDPFYTYTGSKPLGQIAPGTVLEKRSITLVIASLTVPYAAEQVLYRTKGEQGQPTVTVTTIIKPLASLPGTRIVAYQTAYDALGSECDPSYTLRGGNPGTDSDAEAAIIALYVTAGYTVTVPDYEGTRLDWGAGQESGYGTLDGIRATENYLGAASSTKVGMLGYSGGSIATEWASEQAPTYAPELNIIGAASGGVPVDFAHNLTYINGDQDWAGVIPAVLVSVGRAFGVNLKKYLSRYGEKITHQVAGECIASFATNYPGLTVQQLVKVQYQNVFQVPVLVKILNHLLMGTAPGHPSVPLLFGVGNADGTGDGIMIAGDVEALAHEYCKQGLPVTFDEYPGLKHTEAAVPFETHAMTFLTSLFTGLPASNGCSSIGKGNSIAPLPKPAK
ncbi:MAG TPA: lipase family protein [Streptosporangiaceae bacterium]